MNFVYLLGDARTAAVVLSLLLSAWGVYTLDTVNDDGILYLALAERLAAGDWESAANLYGWLFYPWLIAEVHRFTGLGLEASAQMLDALLAALMVFVFVTLVRELGGERKTLLIAGFVILFHPYLNENRPEIIRDHGYWAFYLLALLYFLRFHRHPRWWYALAWGAAIAAATLFRIEGLVIWLLLPMVLWLRKGSRRLSVFLQAYTVAGVLLGAMLLWAVWQGESAWMVEAAGRLDFYWSGFNSGFAEKMAKLRAALFSGHYSEDYALPAMAAIMVLILVDKIVVTLTPLYSVLPWFRSLYERFHPPAGTLAVLIWLSVLNLLAASLFLVAFLLLSKRHVVPLILPVLLVIPFILANLHDRWRDRRRPARWLLPVTLVVLLWMAVDGLVSIGGSSKVYIREAGHWLRDHLPATASLYTNNQKLYYYSGRLLEYSNRGWNPVPQWPITERWLREGDWRQYDYLALWIGRRSEREIRQQLSEMKALENVGAFANDRHDAVLIYRVNAKDAGHIDEQS